MKQRLIIWLVLCASVVASAELFTFTLEGKDGVSWDEVSSGVYTNEGASFTLEAAMYAYLDGVISPGSILNSAASDFGINAVGAGDDTTVFDTNNGDEAIWISFNQAVVIKTITVSNFAASNVETGAYQVASGSIVDFTAGGIYSGIDTVLAQGDYFKVMAVDEGGGNGWSLDSFAVEAVPEPATIALFGIGGILAFIIRRASYE